MKEHFWQERDRDDNENRIRVREECSACGGVRYGCYARQYEVDEVTGTRFWSWGYPLEVWHWTPAESSIKLECKGR